MAGWVTGVASGCGDPSGAAGIAQAAAKHGRGADRSVLAESARSGNQGEREFYRRAGAGASAVARDFVEHVPERVHAGRAAGQPRCRSECPACENVAVGRAMDEFDALSVSGELHAVLADDVAGAERRITRFGALLAGDRAPA